MSKSSCSDLVLSLCLRKSVIFPGTQEWLLLLLKCEKNGPTTEWRGPDFNESREGTKREKVDKLNAKAQDCSVFSSSASRTLEPWHQTHTIGSCFFVASYASNPPLYPPKSQISPDPPVKPSSKSVSTISGVLQKRDKSRPSKGNVTAWFKRCRLKAWQSPLLLSETHMKRRGMKQGHWLFLWKPMKDDSGWEFTWKDVS